MAEVTNPVEGATEVASPTETTAQVVVPTDKEAEAKSPAEGENTAQSTVNPSPKNDLLSEKYLQEHADEDALREASFQESNGLTSIANEADELIGSLMNQREILKAENQNLLERNRTASAELSIKQQAIAEAIAKREELHQANELLEEKYRARVEEHIRVNKKRMEQLAKMHANIKKTKETLEARLPKK